MRMSLKAGIDVNIRAASVLSIHRTMDFHRGNDRDGAVDFGDGDGQCLARCARSLAIKLAN